MNPQNRGAHSKHFRSRFFENINFDVFTSTYAEFDADHKNGLLFGIWVFWKAQEAFEYCKIVFLHLCDQPTGCTGLPDKNSGRPVQASAASGLAAKVQKYNFVNLKCFLQIAGTPNRKTNDISEISVKFCIGRAQNPSFQFLHVA